MEGVNSLTRAVQQSGPGRVLLFGSGEASPGAHRIHERLFATLRPPINAAVLETPAGFELNSAQVAKKVGDFLEASLQNYSPSISIVPARRRDGEASTNNPHVLAPLKDANYIFMGAGSPTYLVRHIRNSVAWRQVIERHRAGGALCLASAAAIAAGAKTLPVYEIFKAGHDLHWIDGLDFFGSFGLELAVVTHWDNADGGADLDTSHGFMGRSRMEALRKLLPPTTLVLGIDEHTGLEFDFQNEKCAVLGRGRVTLLLPGSMWTYGPEEDFSIRQLGPYHPIAALTATEGPTTAQVTREEDRSPDLEPPQEIMDLIRERELARRAHNWSVADALRRRIDTRGFEVQDTREGPHWHRKKAS